MRTRIPNVAVSVLILIPALFASSLLAAPRLAAAAPASPDVRWHFAEAQQRAIVRVGLPDDGEPLNRPVKVLLPATVTAANASRSPSSFRAWDLKTDAEVPAQLVGDQLLLAPTQPIAPGTERVLLVYRTANPNGQAGASLTDDGRVETAAYVAQIDRQHGGILRSLEFKLDGRPVETLSEGFRWWIGRNPQITAESFGPVTWETTAAGPVVTALRVRYPKVLTDANSVIVDYRFFRDFLEVDFRYEVKTPTKVLWLKIPVSLQATGSTPGLTSNSHDRDQELLTKGEKNRWTADQAWHDVSYAGEHPFGLGVIARKAAGGLYFMDSVKADEHEWIYAEPLGWKDPVTVDRDIDVQLTIVPHASGKEAYRQTLAKREAVATTLLSAWQVPGGPAIDSDGDGLPDLVELERGTNPNAADTDLDGLPDGADPDPLRGSPPPRVLRLPEFKAQPTARPQSIAEVKPVLGVPTLVIDGKPYGPMTYTRCAGSFPQLAEIAEHRFPVHFEMVGSIGWPGQQQPVLDGLDSHLHRFLKEVPNARIVLRLYVCNPRNFARDYPDELLRSM